MSKEKWLPVTGYEGLYSVSNFGDVMSMNYNKTGLLKMLQPTTSNCGYLTVHLHKRGKSSHPTIHSLVMKAFIGILIEPKVCINHKNGIKTDNRLSNLEYCTYSENTSHAYDTGLLIPAHGETHCNAKLSLTDIVEIKKKLSEGWTQIELAKLYSIHPSAISRINVGKRWKRALENTNG